MRRPVRVTAFAPSFNRRYYKTDRSVQLQLGQQPVIYGIDNQLGPISLFMVYQGDPQFADNLS